MECPKKCGGELNPFVMNGVKYAQCNKCGSLFTADDLKKIMQQPQKEKSPPPKQKKKGSCLKTMLGLIGTLFVVLIIAFIFIDPEAAEDKATGSNISEDRPPSEFVIEDPPMETLIFQVEAGVSPRYDGYTLDYDETSMTINVWRENITTLADDLLNEGAGADAFGWASLKDTTDFMPDYICDCIRGCGRDMTLTFNVVDDKDHNRIFLTFIDTDLVYDVLAQ